MKTTAIIAGALVLAGSLAAPAAAADKVPVKLKLKGCDGCEVSATWNKTGQINGNFKSKTKTANGNNATLTFNVPKGYYLYFAGTSDQAQVDAATILVTQFVGQKQGSTVSPSKAQTLNQGAYYCLIAKKQTIKAQAALVPDGGFSLLSLWANPQLAGIGTKAKGKDAIKGVYGTQDVLPCKGTY